MRRIRTIPTIIAALLACSIGVVCYTVGIATAPKTVIRKVLPTALPLIITEHGNRTILEDRASGCIWVIDTLSTRIIRGDSKTCTKASIP